MGQDCHPAGLVNGGGRFAQVQPLGDGLCDPQGQDVAVPAADLNTGHNVKRIVVLLFAGPQRSVQRVVVGDGDDVQLWPVAGDEIQQLLCRWLSVAGAGVHV